MQDTYDNLYDKYSRQRIEGKIRDVINKYKYDNDPRIISLVLKNAIVPKEYLPSFFELIYPSSFSTLKSHNLYIHFLYLMDLTNNMNQLFLVF